MTIFPKDSNNKNYEFRLFLSQGDVAFRLLQPDLPRFWYYAYLSAFCQNLRESGSQNFKESDHEKCPF